ncbi:MAG TPA: acetyl-CoA decarbonylase/synthase complex subunit gamma [Anaerolineales bacterium]|nr:acetyl-CoA decarbonylase/synthase complex subunit gamma [Anaerolineales bacterium]
MSLTGLQIYKLLPGTNCRECGYPTCLAFAMKLAAKQVELSLCPYVTEEAKTQLDAASAPPIRLVTVASDGAKVEAGNETVLFRHEKTFYHKPGLFIRVKDSERVEAIKAKVAEADAYVVDYVGIKLGVDGFAVEAASGDGAKFAEAVSAARSVSNKPLILIASNPEVMAAGAKAASDIKPLLYAADESNWQKMAEVAKAAKTPLAVKAESLEKLAGLTEEIKKAGVENMVLDPMARGFAESLISLTQIRRLALKKNFRALGYPVIAFPGEMDGVDETVLAGQYIAKYAGFVVLESFDPATLYPLLVLRQNIYTDPQKPIQVQPGLYEINSPNGDAPLMVTTNFSITYFAVNNEVEGSGWPGWLLVADAEGMSVLTAWAAGKFDADRIAKAVKSTNVESKINHKRLIIPGQVAVLSGELEESLPGWEIMVGPKEAVDIPAYLKVMWGEKVR